MPVFATVCHYHVKNEDKIDCRHYLFTYTLQTDLVKHEDLEEKSDEDINVSDETTFCCVCQHSTFVYAVLSYKT